MRGNPLRITDYGLRRFDVSCNRCGLRITPVYNMDTDYQDYGLVLPLPGFDVNSLHSAWLLQGSRSSHLGLGISLDAAPVVKQWPKPGWLMIIGVIHGYTTQYAGYNHNPSGETLSTNQSKGTTQSFEPRSTGMQCVNCQSSQEMHNWREGCPIIRDVKQIHLNQLHNLPWIIISHRF